VHGHDGLYYVAHFLTGKIKVYALDNHAKLTLVEEVYIGMAIDNLSVDADGDIFAAAFPYPMPVFQTLADQEERDIPSTIFRIRTVADNSTVSGVKYEVTKILEDKEGKVLPSTTTVVHDVVTDRLFLGGLVSRFITICEKRSLNGN
jgi:hypothetical protein